jgi:hypothetical protein
LAPHRQCNVLRCWSDPSPRHHLQASQVGRGLRLRAPVSYQLGRSVLVSLARPAGTCALVTHVRRSAVNRECPPIIVASDPGVARVRTRGLFVPKPSTQVSMLGVRDSWPADSSPFLIVQMDPVCPSSGGARRTRSPGRTADGTGALPAHVGTDHLDRASLTMWSNSFAERYVGTLGRECLGNLRQILTEYAQHYNEHEPHQSREQRPPLREPGQPIDMSARIRRRRAVHGLISEYRREPNDRRNNQIREGARVLAWHTTAPAWLPGRLARWRAGCCLHPSSTSGPPELHPRSVPSR